MQDIDYKRLLNIMDPPEAIEIIANATVRREIMLDRFLLEESIKESLCQVIAKQLIEKDLIEIQCVDSPLYDQVTFYGKIKIFEPKFKLKLLI